MKISTGITDSKKQNRVQALFLLMVTLFIRLPFFTKDYIDRDESTFILMGQSIADGHLPYVHLWDLKPPLLFYIFGLIETLFPYTIEAIRLAGVVVVFASALVIKKILESGGLNNSFWIALAFVMLGSEFGNLQGLMSEHLAVFFLLPGLYLFQQGRMVHYWLAGIFFGAALLCKLSFAHGLVLMVVAHLVFNWKRQSLTRHAVNQSLLGIGVLIPFILIALPYWYQGHIQLFIDSVFRAPLEYAGAAAMSMGEKISRTWWVILLALIIIAWAWKRRSRESTELLLYSMALTAGTVYTFFSSGIVNGHYLVLIYPFLLMMLIGTLPSYQKIRYGWVSLVVVFLSFESLAEYYKVGKSLVNNGHPYYSNTYVIIDELKKQGLSGEKIFFVDYHIGYWMLKTYPLTKSTTHPSNIDRAFLFKYFGGKNSGTGELKYLLDTVRPAVIVSRTPSMGFIRNEMQTRAYFDSVVANEFEPVYIRQEKQVYVWKRK